MKDHDIEDVSSFKYLGIVINNTNYETEEIKARILAAGRVLLSGKYTEIPTNPPKQ
jgi:hypothetical protein